MARKRKSSAIVKAEVADQKVNTVRIEAEIDLERLVEIGVVKLFRLFGGK